MKGKGAKRPLSMAERLDRVVKAVAPVAAARRARARAETARMEALAASYRTKRRSSQRGGGVGASHAASEERVLQDDLPDLIERSRDTWRNNALYSGICRRAVDNLVGTGPMLVPLTGHTGFNNDLQRAFGEYCEAGGGMATSGMSLADVCRVATLTAMREGNALAYRADAGWQFFEGVQIGTPHGYARDGRRVFAGVEVDDGDQPVRYWVADYSTHGYLRPEMAVGIRADRCVMLGVREWFRGFRAVPPLGPALDLFDDLDGYLEAELFGARMASSVVGEMQSTDEDWWRALHQGEEDNVQDTLTQVDFSPGSVFRTMPGEKFQLHAVSRPNSSFDQFTRAMFRLCGVPIGMPLELGLMDFSQTNFSSAKMLMLQAMRTFDVWQAAVPRPLARRVYREWLETWDGKVPRGVRQDDRMRFEMRFPAYPWIDALKEAQARLVGLKGGWLSLEDVAREMNRDLEDVIQERVRQIEMAVKFCEKAGHPEWAPMVLSQVGDLQDLLSVVNMGNGGGEGEA